MTGGPSIEERMRAEFIRMRGEIPAPRTPPKTLLDRAWRGMAVTLTGIIIAVAVVVGGSVMAWNALGPNRPAVPATRGSAASPRLAPDVVASLRSRPLALPSLVPGATCPTTPTVTITPGPGTGFTGTTSAQRAGPVYRAFGGRHVRLRPSDRTPEGSYGIKDVWIVDGTYRGPILLRGGRIDRAGAMEFSFSPLTPRRDALVLDATSPSFQENASTGWWSVPTAAYVGTPGCYAYQIDGTTFTRYITFDASR